MVPLILPFGEQELENIIKELPMDKALGTDGFSGLFIKTCLPTINQDFINLSQSFYHHNANLKCINNSYITLVPKKQNPEKVSDFRPISLLNSAIKFLIHGIKLQKVILRVIHRNQYGFLQGRSIHDFLT